MPSLSSRWDTLNNQVMEKILRSLKKPVANGLQLWQNKDPDLSQANVNPLAYTAGTDTNTGPGIFSLSQQHNDWRVFFESYENVLELPKPV